MPRFFEQRTFKMAMTHTPTDEEKVQWLRGFMEKVWEEAPKVAPMPPLLE